MMEAIRIPPDLVVEVLSRSTEVRDRGRKMQMVGHAIRTHHGCRPTGRGLAAAAGSGAPGAEFREAAAVD